MDTLVTALVWQAKDYIDQNGRAFSTFRSEASDLDNDRIHIEMDVPGVLLPGMHTATVTITDPPCEDYDPEVAGADFPALFVLQGVVMARHRIVATDLRDELWRTTVEASLGFTKLVATFDLDPGEAPAFDEPVNVTVKIDRLP